MALVVSFLYARDESSKMRNLHNGHSELRLDCEVSQVQGGYKDDESTEGAAGVCPLTVYNGIGIPSIL